MATPLHLSLTGTAVGTGVLDKSMKKFQNQPKPVVSFEEARAVLEEKIATRFKSVRQAFAKFDMDSDGFISDMELRHNLVLLGIDMSAAEYKKLWAYFDQNRDGKISYAEFNNKMGTVIHPKGDMDLKRPETPKVKDWHVRAMARGLQRKLRDMELAFKEVDSDNSGTISHQEFIQLLRKLGLVRISNEESFQMMQKFKRPDNYSGELTLEEFRDTMADYLDMNISEMQTLPDYSYIAKPPTSALELLEQKLFSKFSAVQRAFRHYDVDRSGSISHEELKRLLLMLHIELTSVEFQSLVKIFDPENSGEINYNAFNRVIGHILHPPSTDTSRGMQLIEELAGAQEGLVFNPKAVSGRKERPFRKNPYLKHGGVVTASSTSPPPEAMAAMNCNDIANITGDMQGKYEEMVQIQDAVNSVNLNTQPYVEVGSTLGSRSTMQRRDSIEEAFASESPDGAASSSSSQGGDSWGTGTVYVTGKGSAAGGFGIRPTQTISLHRAGVSTAPDSLRGVAGFIDDDSPRMISASAASNRNMTIVTDAPLGSDIRFGSLSPAEKRRIKKRAENITKRTTFANSDMNATDDSGFGEHNGTRQNLSWTLDGQEPGTVYPPRLDSLTEDSEDELGTTIDRDALLYTQQQQAQQQRQRRTTAGTRTMATNQQTRARPQSSYAALSSTTTPANSVNRQAPDYKYDTRFALPSDVRNRAYATSQKHGHNQPSLKTPAHYPAPKNMAMSLGGLSSENKLPPRPHTAHDRLSNAQLSHQQRERSGSTSSASVQSSESQNNSAYYNDLEDDAFASEPYESGVQMDVGSRIISRAEQDRRHTARPATAGATLSSRTFNPSGTASRTQQVPRNNSGTRAPAYYTAQTRIHEPRHPPLGTGPHSRSAASASAASEASYGGDMGENAVLGIQSHIREKLGRRWIVLLQEFHQVASDKDQLAVSKDVFRDMLATYQVPLTSTQVDTLAQAFPGPASDSVHLAAFFQRTFRAPASALRRIPGREIASSGYGRTSRATSAVASSFAKTGIPSRPATASAAMRATSTTKFAPKYTTICSMNDGANESQYLENHDLQKSLTKFGMGSRLPFQANAAASTGYLSYTGRPSTATTLRERKQIDDHRNLHTRIHTKKSAAPDTPPTSAVVTMRGSQQSIF